LLQFDGDGGAVFANAAMQGIARRARRCSGRGPGGIVTVPRREGAKDYVILVAPPPGALRDLTWDSAGEAGALILVHDPDARPPQNAAEILEQAMHLPKGAARLVAALCADEDLKSFSEREGITIHTVRWHLRAALARTGARTQAELVRLAVRLLRDIALSIA
jgi:hypothetical protein